MNSMEPLILEVGTISPRHRNQTGLAGHKEIRHNPHQRPSREEGVPNTQKGESIKVHLGLLCAKRVPGLLL